MRKLVYFILILIVVPVSIVAAFGKNPPGLAVQVFNAALLVGLAVQTAKDHVLSIDLALKKAWAFLSNMSTAWTLTALYTEPKNFGDVRSVVTFLSKFPDLLKLENFTSERALFSLEGAMLTVTNAHSEHPELGSQNNSILVAVEKVALPYREMSRRLSTKLFPLLHQLEKQAQAANCKYTALVSTENKELYKQLLLIKIDLPTLTEFTVRFNFKKDFLRAKISFDDRGFNIVTFDLPSLQEAAKRFFGTVPTRT